MSKPSQQGGPEAKAASAPPGAPAPASVCNLATLGTGSGRSTVGMAAADASKSARLAELQERAAILMRDLPPILRSDDILRFCEVVMPAVVKVRDDGLAEKFRASTGTEKNGDVKNAGTTGDATLLDVRKFETWGEAAESVHAAFVNCVNTVASETHSSEQGAKVGAKRRWDAGPWDIAHGRWTAWEETDVEGETLRLATCNKCQRVVTQRRYPPVPVLPLVPALQLGRSSPVSIGQRIGCSSRSGRPGRAPVARGAPLPGTSVICTCWRREPTAGAHGEGSRRTGRSAANSTTRRCSTTSRRTTATSR